MIRGDNRLFVFVFIQLVTFCLSFPGASFAADSQTVITSDKLEYFGEENKYVATGSAEVERDGAILKSDEITYDEDTSEAVASGHVTYDDLAASMKADRAEMNLDTKTGTLYDAEVLYKKYNYHIAGKEIEKRGDDYYFSPEAAFTTCDAPIPAWCFRGKDINAVIDKKLTARNATFRIRDLPVLYTPYLWASLVKERQTGVLMPILGNSNSLGASMSLPFYWVIAENRDATVVFDIYSKRGLGTGLEYRFVEPSGANGNLWAYHIKDTELEKDFWEVRGLTEVRNPERLGGYLNINYVNEKDFYQVYSSRRDIRIARYLESTGELNLPLPASRLYLLSQYRQDLKNDNALVPQKLPEAGYALNYTPLGSFFFSADLTAANLWRENGQSALRADIYPRLLHSLGRDFVLTQAVALRETAYSFYKEGGDQDSSTQRAAFEYDVTAHTRLYKTYSSFTHIIEPSVRYHFIYSSDNNLPVFDSSELLGKTSNIELSVLNRGVINGKELFAIRLTQTVDTYNSDNPFLPLKLDVALNTPVPLTMEAEYDVKTGKIETVTSDISFQLFKATVTAGQRYNRQEDVMMYTTYVGFSPSKALQLAGQVWYDAKGAGLRDMALSVRYQKQCWGVRFEAIRRPGDFSMKVLFDLAGLSSKTPRSLPGYSPTL